MDSGDAQADGLLTGWQMYNALPLMFVALQVWLQDAIPIVVRLVADTAEISRGDPVLLKVAARNWSCVPVAFSPPLQGGAHLRFECKPPGEETFRLVAPHDSRRPRPGHPRGWQPGVTFVSYDYLFRSRLTIVPGAPNQTPMARERYAFDREGDWLVRAVVVANSKKFYSPEIAVRIRGTRGKAAEDAIEACADPLRLRLMVPSVQYDDKEIGIYRKHLPVLLGTPAELPLRRTLILDELRLASTPNERNLAVGRFKDFRATLSPLQQEYTELLFGIVLVQRKEIDAAREVLKTIADRSYLRDYIERGVTQSN